AASRVTRTQATTSAADSVWNSPVPAAGRKTRIPASAIPFTKAPSFSGTTSLPSAVNGGGGPRWTVAPREGCRGGGTARDPGGRRAKAQTRELLLSITGPFGRSFWA